MIDTKNKIIKTTRKIFAKNGYDGVSMSVIAEKTDIAKSVIYHYFPSKDILLREMFDKVSTELGLKRKKMKWSESAMERLYEVIKFQFENAEDIVVILKYYAAFRDVFKRLESGGYIPTKAYLHIEEVLQHGALTGEFEIHDLKKDAKVITHTINGFVLEYFPRIPRGSEREQLITEITRFILRAIVSSSQNRKGVYR